MSAIAMVAAAIVSLSWGQSKPAQVEDAFPPVDCAAFDFGKSVVKKHSDACQSFVQLVKAKDKALPLFVGPVYACFGIKDELFVVDTSMDQARSDDKKWAALAQPQIAFYRSGIETGVSTIPVAMEGKWDLMLSPTAVSYSGTTESETAKELEQTNKGLKIPSVTLTINDEQIAFGDLKIQSSTGRFTYWTDPFGSGKNLQVSGQCAIFKRDLSSQNKVLEFSWKKAN